MVTSIVKRSKALDTINIIQSILKRSKAYTTEVIMDFQNMRCSEVRNWVREMSPREVRELIHTNQVIASAIKRTYCCLNMCFPAPSDQVDGIACRTCKQYSYCHCRCVRFLKVKAESGDESLYERLNAFTYVGTNINRASSAVEAGTNKLHDILAKIETFTTYMEDTVKQYATFLPEKKHILSRFVLAIVNGVTFRSFLPLWQEFCGICVEYGLNWQETYDLIDEENRNNVGGFYSAGDGHPDYINAESGLDKITALFSENLDTQRGKIPVLMAVMLTVVLGCLAGVKLTMANLLSHFSTVGRACQGLAFTQSSMTKVFEWVDGYFCKKFLGKERADLDMDKVYPHLSGYLALAEYLKGVDARTQCYQSRECCVALIGVDKALLRYDILAQSRGDHVVRGKVKLARNELKQVVDLACSIVNENAQSRVPPTVIMLHGSAGVGKTELMHFMCKDIADKYYESRAVDSLVYDRQVETEYWDGYNSQHKIVKYDDAFQMVDTPSKPNPEFMEIIRCSNSEPYNVHMAAVEDKGHTYFSSDFVFITTNISNPKPVSIKDQSAFDRRINVKAHVRVKQQVAKKSVYGNFDVLDPMKVLELQNPGMSRADILKSAASGDLVAKLSSDYYELDVEYLEAGSLVKKVMEYADLMEVVDNHRKQMEKQHAQKKKPDCDSEILKRIQTINAESGDEFLRAGETFYDAEEGYGFPKGLAWHNSYLPDCILESGPLPDDVKAESIYDMAVSCFKISKDKVTELAERAKQIVKDYWGVLIGKSPVDFIWSVLKYVGPILVLALGALGVYRALTKPCALKDGLKSDISVLKLLGKRTCFFGCDFCKDFKAHSIHIQTELVKKPGLEPYYTIRKDSLNHWFVTLMTVAGTHKVPVAPHFSAELLTMPKRYVRTKPEDRPHCSEDLAQGEVESYARHVAAEYVEALPKKVKAEYVEANPRKVNAEYVEAQPKKVNAESEVSDYIRDHIALEGLVIDAHAATDEIAYKQTGRVMSSSYVRLINDRDLGNNGVVVQGRLCLVNTHFASSTMACGGRLRVINVGDPRGTEHEVKVKRFVPLMNNGEETDISMFELPEYFPACPDIRKYFLSEEDFTNLNTFYRRSMAYVASISATQSRYGVSMRIPMMKQVTPKEINTTRLSIVDKDQQVTYINHFCVYNGQTVPGDCGSPVILFNDNLRHKFVGVHCGGTKGEGFAQVVTREMLDEATRAFTRQITAHSSLELAWPKEGVFSNAKTLGKLTTTINLPKSSSKLPSELHGVFPIKKKPAVLGDFEVLEKNAAKLSRETTVLDEEILEECSQHIDLVLGKKSSVEKRVFSKEEAIAGIEDSPWESMCRSTSPGFPFNKVRPGAGKHPWISENHRDPTSPFKTNDKELNRAVNDIVYSAKHGVRLLESGIFTASLKDELRTLDKVEAKKTRVFTACSLDLSIAIRQYFGSFVLHAMENKIDNEIGLGINPFGPDWGKLARKLKTKGDNIIAGDFSNFDGSLNAQILRRIVHNINRWYDDDEENKLVRRTLFEYLVNAVVLLPTREGSFLVQLNHSQPSGNPLTTVINCMYNMYIFRYCYILLQGKNNMPQGLHDYNRNVYGCYYGDDSILSVTSTCLEWFNQKTITDAMSETGHDYTDETKSKSDVFSKSLDSCTFLKRSFVKRGGHWFAPLDKLSIETMPMWYMKKWDDLDHLDAVLKIATLEAYFHGPEYFQHYTDIVRNGVIERGLSNVHVSTYRECQYRYDDMLMSADTTHTAYTLHV